MGMHQLSAEGPVVGVYEPTFGVFAERMEHLSVAPLQTE